ncbi:hypothetical protein C6H92_01670 [Chlamydia muridarum str. Nigg]|nr:hypothetical protein C6H95_01675 [Chlamydia muridarum str. Nigg]AVM90778.1 hypothetical protein C6H93_01670 [Chlamydia muridarum str. Nigg]AVM91676.1 hypothetical protein C6H92_01670 [Chlamydia muridarum str. Nigg]AVM96134.1 hypothetical protein C6H87_01670 [Chlamydia muridarum str. Nigg]
MNKYLGTSILLAEISPDLFVYACSLSAFLSKRMLLPLVGKSNLALRGAYFNHRTGLFTNEK